MDALLEHSSVFIHLDPRGEDVMVPGWFKKQPQLVLQVGLNLAVPIRDLALSERGVTCTLSFNRSPHFCVLPWGSVFALVAENGRGMVWPDDVPPEVVVEQQGQASAPGKASSPGAAAGPSAASKGKKARSARAKLRAVPGGVAAAGPEASAAPEPQATRPRTAGAAAAVMAPAGEAAGHPGGESPTAPESPPGQASGPKKAPRPSYLRVVK